MLNFKRISKILLSCALVGAIFTGCGGGNTTAPEKTHAKIGMLTNLNASEQQINEFMKKAEEEAQVQLKLSYDYVYYDSLSALLMGLQSKSVDEISTYRSVSDYLVARISDLAVIDGPPLKLSDSFCSALRAEDTELRDELNAALAAMKEDGTLESLQKHYIFDLDKEVAPPAVEIANIEGADTIRIAVTGDLPPLDLVLTDGAAAGFNTAVLSEISKRINKNIKVIDIDSSARAAALTSGEVDVVFWVIVPDDDSGLPADIDTPKEIIVTDSYFKDEIVHVGNK